MGIYARTWAVEDEIRQKEREYLKPRNAADWPVLINKDYTYYAKSMREKEPGHASERAAKIFAAKNHKGEDVIIVPFLWRDGVRLGSRVTVRYLVLVREAEQ